MMRYCLRNKSVPLAQELVHKVEKKYAIINARLVLFYSLAIEFFSINYKRKDAVALYHKLRCACFPAAFYIEYHT